MSKKAVFDWTDVLGEKALLRGDGKKTVDPKTLSQNDVIGLYFSAHWCPPCRGFTPVLAQHYRKAKSAANAETTFEIVFVSSDRDEESFDEYRAEMPWCALNFSDRDVKAALSKKFEVRGIPMLVFLDAKTGDVLSKDGRSLVAAHGANFAAKAKNAAKDKADAMKMLKDLSVFDVEGKKNESVRKADVIVTAFGDASNRGWAEYVKPKLKEVCAALQKDNQQKKVNVFFVPMNMATAVQRPEDCWTPLPPGHNLSVFQAALGGAIEAPHVLVMNAKGDILVEDAARECYETGIDGFPWDKDGMERFQRKKQEKLAEMRKGVKDLKCFEKVKILDGQGGEVSIKSIRDNADVVGLYFSAHWCGPCRNFTPQLAAQYAALKKAGKKIEIIFVSSDQDKSSFEGYFAHMPWRALDFSARDLKDTLSEIFEVEGIPSLVLLNPNGEEITKDGRSRIMSSVDAFPYDAKSMAALKQKILLKEAAVAKAQLDGKKIVFKRHCGAPGKSVLDAKSNTIDFKAFDTFAADVKYHAVNRGKWMYEITAVNVDRGICQVGWVDAKFAANDRSTGEGVGDDAHGWAFDGNRVSIWHKGEAKSWGAAMKNGDVIGCAIDLDNKTVSFGLNGKWDGPFGKAFDNISFDAGGVVPAISAQGMNYKLQYNFGSESFKFGPPSNAVYNPFVQRVRVTNE